MKASILLSASSITSARTAEFVLDRGQLPASLFARGLATGEVATVQFLAAGDDPGVALLIDDAEDAWNESVEANTTSTADAVTFKVGTKSAKLAVGANAVAGAVLATEAVGPLDLSRYDQITLWLQPSVAIAANDLQLLLDDTANCASPVLTRNIPALTQNVWNFVVLPYDRATAGLTAIRSMGVKMVVDKGAFNLFIDDVRAEQGWTDFLVGNVAQKLDVQTTLLRLDQPGQYRLRCTAAAGPVVIGIY